MTTPYTVVAISWSNDGTSVDVSGAITPNTGCKRCPIGVDVQTGPLAAFGNPACVLVLNFASLVAASAWKSSQGSNFDFVCWQATGACC